MSGSLGGGKSKNKTSQDASTVWGPQAGYLQDMYGRAQGMMSDQAGNQMAQQGYNNAQGFGQQQQQGVQQALGPGWLQDAYGTSQSLQNTAQGQQALGRATGDQYGSLGRLNDQQGQYQAALNTIQPGNNPQLAAYAKQVGQQFNEQVLPGLQGQAMQAGGYGGSRAGIAQGLAGARAGQQIQDMGAQIYGQDMARVQDMFNQGQNRDLNLYQQQLGRDQGIWQQQQQGALGAAGLNADVFGRGLAGAAQGQQGALQAGAFGQQMPWANLKNYAGLLGGPTVLGGASRGKGSSWDIQSSGGFM